MSTVDRAEKTVTTVEFTIPAEKPWGACWTEIMLAIRMAHNELHALDPHRYPKGEDVSDDAIRMFPRDDEIVVVYEKETT